jgi:hypothetical protein
LVSWVALYSVVDKPDREPAIRSCACNHIVDERSGLRIIRSEISATMGVFIPRWVVFTLFTRHTLTKRKLTTKRK